MYYLTVTETVHMFIVWNCMILLILKYKLV